MLTDMNIPKQQQRTMINWSDKEYHPFLSSGFHHGNISVKKVTQDFNLTYSKMGVGIKIIKSDFFSSIFLHKIICCERVLELPRRDDSNTHLRSIILWRLIITEIKKKHWSLVKTV